MPTYQHIIIRTNFWKHALWQTFGEFAAKRGCTIAKEKQKKGMCFWDLKLVIRMQSYAQENAQYISWADIIRTIQNLWLWKFIWKITLWKIPRKEEINGL